MIEDRTELTELASQQAPRVQTMQAEWFRLAEHTDRLKGRALAPAGDTIKSLNFRKDTSSGSATDGKSNKKKK